MRIVIRTSRTALWAQRLGVFSIAVLLVAAALRYWGRIAYDVFEICLLLAGFGAALALALALLAYIRLWFSGDRGWAPASAGLILGVLGLLPLGVSAALALRYPATVTVSTAPADPPAFARATPTAITADPETILAAYPDLITRIHQVAPEILFELAETLIGDMGWETIAADPAAGRLNALRPGILGGGSEIALRIAPGMIGGATIDLAATALEPPRHDLGENGRALEAFLLALDTRVDTVIARHMAETEAEETFEVIDGGEDPEF